MPKGFSEHEKEMIAARLLEQGERLFSAYGLKKTNVEEIAQAVGISKGAFYIFYDSKEALFMAVIEQVEQRARREILSMVDLPGPTARLRLYAVLKKAFSLFMSLPILRFFTGSDFDLLFRRIPEETLREHMASDGLFIHELISRCQAAGIAIKARPEEVMAMLYPLVFSSLNPPEAGFNRLSGNLDLLLELVAAYCLGEVDSQLPALEQGSAL